MDKMKLDPQATTSKSKPEFLADPELELMVPSLNKDLSYNSGTARLSCIRAPHEISLPLTPQTKQINKS